MQPFQTAGAPPRSGSSSLPVMGSTRNSSRAARNRVALYSGSRALVMVAGPDHPLWRGFAGALLPAGRPAATGHYGGPGVLHAPDRPGNVSKRSLTRENPW